MTSDAAIWHELECGSYNADFDCWRELASEYQGPILDVGCGTGRIALMLAGLGHDVTALDLDDSLLTALTQRAGKLEIETICADAREFEAGHAFKLIIVPMLTVQLFGGSLGRAKFFAAAASQLSTGGCIALAIANLLDDEEATAGGEPATADTCVIDSVGYSTRAVGLRQHNGQIGIERRREVTAPDGSLAVQAATDWIDILTAQQLEAEALSAGLKIAPRRHIPPTADYVGSAVICLHG